jgi:hypothetical protein
LTAGFDRIGPLEAAQAASFLAGSNLPGQARGASWCFTLPSLDLGRIVCLGRPSREALAALARLGQEVLVCAPAGEIKNVAAWSREIPGVAVLERQTGQPIAIEEASTDLVYVPHRVPASEAQEIERLLKPNGAVYTEYRSFARDTRALSRLARLGSSRVLWLGPASGDVRTAAPVEDEGTIHYLERRFLAWRVLRRRLLREPLRVLGREPLVNRLARRRGLIVQGSSKNDRPGPPQYLRAIAANAGIDLEGRRWGLAAPGRYGSQKVLVFIFDTTGEAPTLVAKITREARHNARLANEWRALNLLREQGIGIDGTIPQPAFFGSHASLAVVGQTAIEGVPFLKRTEARTGCPYARAAIDSLLELGARTAQHPSFAPHPAEALRPLVDRFAEIYPVAKDHVAFLVTQADALAEAGATLPLVFQHGDPGPWNLLVTIDGRPAFLDWEAAEPRGLPLWDLFHFFRSFGVMISKAARQNNPLQSFREQILADSALSRLLVEKTARACSETGLEGSLVEPLFYLSWMHRALKEASRLRQDELGAGRYLNVLRLAIEERDSPGLCRLFAIEAPA